MYNLLDIVAIPPGDDLDLIIGILQLLGGQDVMNSPECQNSDVNGLNLQCVVKVIAAQPDIFEAILYGLLRYGDEALGMDLGIDPIVSTVIKNFLGTSIN